MKKKKPSMGLLMLWVLGIAILIVIVFSSIEIPDYPSAYEKYDGDAYENLALLQCFEWRSDKISRSLEEYRNVLDFRSLCESMECRTHFDDRLVQISEEKIILLAINCTEWAEESTRNLLGEKP